MVRLTLIKITLLLVLSVAALPIEATPQDSNSPAEATPTQSYSKAPAYAKPTQSYSKEPAYAKPTQSYSKEPAYAKPTQSYSKAPAYATPTEDNEAPDSTTPTGDNKTPAEAAPTEGNNSSSGNPALLPPGGSPVYVGLANQCGLIGGINYVCWPNSGLICDTMPGQTQRICLRVSQQGGPCNNQFTKCATGLTCDIPFGQWAGTCVSGNPPPPTPPPVHVGLANQCGLIGGINYVCQPNSGLTCDTMPGQTQRICVQTAQLNQSCNNQFTKCAAGLVCRIPPGQWAGTCN